MNTKINAVVVADSLSPQGKRLTTFLVTFPRIILAEVNTHRMFSRNTSSSRAIPFKKMLEVVEKDPFIPVAWQKEHKGMQGHEYIEDYIQEACAVSDWLDAKERAIKSAKELHKNSSKGTVQVSKQLCNRLLEPWMWVTMIITTSTEGLVNFFDLRCPQYYYDLEDKYFKSKKEWLQYYKQNCIGNPESDFKLDPKDWFRINKGQAEIHMMALAEAMYDAYNESTPQQLKEGEWHIPFKDKIDAEDEMKWYREARIKVATAMCAKTSYTVIGEEKEVDYKKLLALHDKLISQVPLHASPMEHCCRAMTGQEYVSFVKGFNPPADISDGEGNNYYRTNDSDINGWCDNYHGFISYRHILENRLKK